MGIHPNNEYYVESVNGDQITLTATHGGAAIDLTASTASSTHNFQLELPDFSDIEISYDMANQAFRFTQTEESKVNQLYISTGDQSGINNSVLGVGEADFANDSFGTLLSPLDQDDSVTLLSMSFPMEAYYVRQTIKEQVFQSVMPPDSSLLNRVQLVTVQV